MKKSYKHGKILMAVVASYVFSLFLITSQAWADTITTATTTPDTVTTGETVNINAGGSIDVSGYNGGSSNAINGAGVSGVTVNVNSGTITADGISGAKAIVLGNNANIAVANGATVQNYGADPGGSPDGSAISTGSGAVIIIAGNVYTDATPSAGYNNWTPGIEVGANSNITVQTTGVVQDSAAFGPAIQLSSGSTLTNSGTLTSTWLQNANAVVMAATSNITINNNGAITAVLFGGNTQNAVVFGTGGTSTGNVLNLYGATSSVTGNLINNGAVGGATVNFGYNGTSSDGTTNVTITGSIGNTGNAWNGVAYGGISTITGTAAFNTLQINSGATLNLDNGATTGSLNGAGGTIDVVAGTLSTGALNSSDSYAGVVSGSGALTKTGINALVLSGANTYTGATTISAGTLQIGNGGTTGSLSTSSTITDNGTLVFDRTNTITQGADFAAGISGNGGVTQAGSGNLVLGANTYTGATTINAGKIIFDNSLTTSALNFSGSGTAEFISGTNVSNAITTSTPGQGTVTFDNGNHTISGDIGSASAGVSQVNVGTNATSFGGNVYASGFAFTGNGGNVTVASGKSLAAPITEAVDGASTINYAGSTTISYDIGTSGSKLAYVNLNGGTVNLGANIYTDPASQGGTGATTVSGATLNLTQDSAVYGKLALSSGAVNLNTSNLTVNGTYTQSASTTLDLTVNSASSYGKINATTATVAGGTSVNVTLNGGYIANGTVLSVISAGTGSSYGTPTSILSNDPRITFTAVTSGNNWELVVNRTSSGFEPLGKDANAQSAGGVLDNITNPTSGMTTILNTLEGLSNAQVTSALSTMTPTIDAGIRDNSAAALNNFVGASIDRAQNVLNLASAGNSKTSGVSAGDQGKLNGLWAKEYGSYLNQGTDQGVPGYYAWNTGTAVGIDHLFGDTLTVGVSGGYAYGNVTSAANYGATSINSAQSTLYAGYQNAEHPYFIDAAASSAWNWYSGQRNITVGNLGYDASSEYRGQQYGTYLDGGYNFNLDNKLQLTPIASLQWDHLALGHYTETGADALDLRVNRQSYDILESGLGVRVSTPKMAYQWGDLSPEAHVKWLHDFISDGMSVTSAYTGGGGAFTTNGIKPALNGVNVGGKLSFDFKNDISIIAGIDTEVKDHFFAVAGTAEVRYKF